MTYSSEQLALYTTKQAKDITQCDAHLIWLFLKYGNSEIVTKIISKIELNKLKAKQIADKNPTNTIGTDTIFYKMIWCIKEKQSYNDELDKFITFIMFMSEVFKTFGLKLLPKNEEKYIKDFCKYLDAVLETDYAFAIDKNMIVEYKISNLRKYEYLKPINTYRVETKNHKLRMYNQNFQSIIQGYEKITSFLNVKSPKKFIKIHTAINQAKLAGQKIMHTCPWCLHETSSNGRKCTTCQEILDELYAAYMQNIKTPNKPTNLKNYKQYISSRISRCLKNNKNLLKVRQKRAEYLIKEMDNVKIKPQIKSQLAKKVKALYQEAK